MNTTKHCQRHSDSRPNSEATLVVDGISEDIVSHLLMHTRPAIDLRSQSNYGQGASNWELHPDSNLNPVAPNLPELGISKPEKSKRRKTKKKPKVPVEPNLPLYEPLLLSTSRAPFVPRQVRDGVHREKHPYSGLLSLSSKERKVYLREKANRTRPAVGNPPVPPHDDTEAAEWRCGWFSFADAGSNVPEWNCDNEEYESVLKVMSKVTEETNAKLEVIGCCGPGGGGSPVPESHQSDVSTQATEHSKRLARTDLRTGCPCWRDEGAGGER